MCFDMSMVSPPFEEEESFFFNGGSTKFLFYLTCLFGVGSEALRIF